MTPLFLQTNNQDIAIHAIDRMTSQTFQAVAVILTTGVVISIIAYTIICGLKGNVPFSKKKFGNKKEKSTSKEEYTPVVINNNIENNSSSSSIENSDQSLEYVKNNLNMIINDWHNKDNVLDKDNQESIESVRTNQISKILNQVLGSYARELDEEAEDYDVIRQMFTLIINYHFNNLLLEKLKSLEKNPTAAYADTTLFIANACTDMVESIKQVMLDCELFQRNKEARVAFEEVFKNIIPTLNKSIEEYLKFYLQKQDQWKSYKQKNLEDRNEAITSQLKHLISYVNKEGGN